MSSELVAKRNPAQLATGILNRLARWRHALPILLITVVGLVVNSPSVVVGNLSGDDWGYLGLAAQGRLACPVPDIRPLASCAFVILQSALGLKPAFYHLVLMVLMLIAAILLYLNMTYLFIEVSVPLVISVLFLVYPTVWTHQWIVTICHQLAYIILFAGFLCMISFVRYQRWGAWGVGVVLVCLSLLFYEVQLGLIVLLAAAFLLLTRRQAFPYRVAALVSLIVAGIYAIIRWRYQVETGNAFGHATDGLALKPLDLARQLMTGYRIQLQWGWTIVFERLYPMLLAPRERLLIRATPVVFLGLLLALGAAAYRKQGGFTGRSRGYALAAVLGLIMIGAGYIPVITAIPPDLSYEATRGNVMPSIGAALFIASLAAWAASGLAKTKQQMALLTFALVLPLIGIGVFTQSVVQADTRVSWEEQKSIWRQLLQMAPQLSPGTTVIFLMPEGNRSLGPPPLASGSWSVRTALSLFYGHDDIMGYFAYPTMGRVDLACEGIIVPQSPAPIPYDRAFVVRYSDETDRLDRVAEVQRTCDDGTSSFVTLCSSCIQGDHGNPNRYADLVR